MTAQAPPARDGWSKVRLGDVCELRYGKSLPAGQRSGSGYPVYGSNGEVGRHDSALTSGATVVVGRKGSFGEVRYSADPCWPIDTTYYIDEGSTEADLRWLFHLLLVLPLKDLNRAAAIPGLNREDAYDLPVMVPPIEEQLRIAALLDAAEALRGKRRQALAKLDILPQAIFIEMFGDPVSNPRSLPTTFLGEFGTLDRGVSKHRPRNDPPLLGGAWPLIQTGDVANSGGYIDSYSSTYSDLGLAQSKIWPAGTLCITIAANIAKTGILMFDACFPDSVVGFATDVPERSEYVRAFMRFLQPVLEQQAPESAQKNINLKVLRELEIPVPPASEVARFSSAVASAVQLASSVAVSQTRLDSLFASLQQRSFRGEL